MTVTTVNAVPSAVEPAVFCRPVVTTPAVARRDGTVLPDAWLPDLVLLGELERHLGDGVIEAAMDAAVLSRPADGKTCSGMPPGRSSPMTSRPRCCLAGMMLLAADGMLVNLPDTPANRAFFGSTGTADDSSPFRSCGSSR